MNTRKRRKLTLFFRTLHSTLGAIKAEKGYANLWRGIGPAIGREIVFSGMKLSLYEPIRNSMCTDEMERLKTPLLKKIAAGIVSGGVACYFSSPFDVVKIRMQDNKRARHYRSGYDCFKKIYLKEGVGRGFFAGVWPNIGRNCIMNAAELTAYDTTRQFVLNNTSLPDHPALYLLYGTVAGAVGCLVANPVDLVKTRMMNNPEVYKGIIHTIKKTYRQGGLTSFYNGIKPFMARACSFNALMFLFYGYFRQYFGKLIDGE